MENLVSGLQQFLASPEGQERLAGLQNLLGSAAPPAGANGGPDLSSLLGLFSGGTPEAAPEAAALPQTGQADPQSPLPFDPAILIKLMQLLSQSRPDDRDAQLLLALRPFFSPRRQTRVDQAMRILRLLSLLPALRESGLLSDLKGLF